MEEKNLAGKFLNAVYQASITLPYDYFKIYVGAISNNIEKELKNYEEKLEDRKKREGFFSTFMQSVIHEVNKTSMPKYFYNANLILIYSKFESDFKSICTVYQQQKNFKLSASDLDGRNYIEKSRKYLKKCCGLNMDALNTEWTSITQYQNVRNAIAHHNSNIMRQKEKALNKQELFPIVSGNSSLVLDNNNGDFYIKDKKYLLDFCDLAKTYISKTLELMEN